MDFKDILKPKKIKIAKIFVNSNTGQMSIALPRKKIKTMPKRVEVIAYW